VFRDGAYSHSWDSPYSGLAQHATAELHNLFTTTEGLPVNGVYTDRVVYLTKLYENLAISWLNQSQQVQVAGLSATFLPMIFTCNLNYSISSKLRMCLPKVKNLGLHRCLGTCSQPGVSARCVVQSAPTQTDALICTISPMKTDT
jgi:hypothetical protein